MGNPSYHVIGNQVSTWMVRSRKGVLLCLIGLVLVLAATFSVSYIGLSETRFTQAQLERVKLGMTHRQVEDALGCPSGDYTEDGFDPPPAAFLSDIYTEFWAGPDGAIGVNFDPQTGKVRYATLYPNNGDLSDPTPAKRLKRVLQSLSRWVRNLRAWKTPPRTSSPAPAARTTRTTSTATAP